jgi:hypothetical protein
MKSRLSKRPSAFAFEVIGFRTKNLSVNNVDGQRYATEGNDRRGQVIEGDEAAFQFLVSH